MPQVLAHQTVVFLFHHAVIVFLIGTAAAQLHPDHFVFPEVHQMGIEELTAIIRMQFSYRKGHPRQDATEACFHSRLPAPQDCYPFAPESRPHREAARCSRTRLRYSRPHDAPSRSQNGLAPGCPTGCAPWGLLWSPGSLALVLSGASALCGLGVFATCAPPWSG